MAVAPRHTCGQVCGLGDITSPGSDHSYLAAWVRQSRGLNQDFWRLIYILMYETRCYRVGISYDILQVYICMTKVNCLELPKYISSYVMSCTTYTA